MAEPFTDNGYEARVKAQIQNSVKTINQIRETAEGTANAPAKKQELITAPANHPAATLAKKAAHDEIILLSHELGHKNSKTIISAMEVPDTGVIVWRTVESDSGIISQSSEFVSGMKIVISEYGPKLVRF